jgi:hypothetical protein
LGAEVLKMMVGQKTMELMMRKLRPKPKPQLKLNKEPLPMLRKLSVSAELKKKRSVKSKLKRKKPRDLPTKLKNKIE